MINRRYFLQSMAAGAAVLAFSNLPGYTLEMTKSGEDVFAYIKRIKGHFDVDLYRQILGAANEFKEGDQIIGVAAKDDATRIMARELLSNTRISAIVSHPLLNDDLQLLINTSLNVNESNKVSGWTLGELKQFVLTDDPAKVKATSAGLSSEVIACVVKLMSNDELILAGSRIFSPLPGSNIGAKGYLGARLQPNSPTDNTDDIFFQVLDGWSYGVGDVVLGTNPVSSNTDSILAIELTLKDILHTFGLEEVMPHCVLSHIDLQAEVEAANPGTTGIWFQSIAGSDSANATFDISNYKMLKLAAKRTGKYGLYFETGQGADFTNGHSHGFDMVIHESRKYGFARVLTGKVAEAQKEAGNVPAPWVHLNDVAGFIGPEVFRRRDQLVRCCLEDIVMGKLHGLTLGLDICATLHMDITLDDLDWCVDQIMPANPAYLMALPTKIDPMLGYLTTGFQDHVRIREKFGYKVNDRMWEFFKLIGIIDSEGKPTIHFGDPLWVFLQYQRRKGDIRSDADIFNEGQTRLEAIKKHGVFIARGYGKDPAELEPSLDKTIRGIDADARKCIWAILEPAFVGTLPGVLNLATNSADRSDYILHPASGEKPSEESLKKLKAIRRKYRGKYNVQIVISDGLDALSISDNGHMIPYLDKLKGLLETDEFKIAPTNIVVTSGRVRAGYRIGETLFANLSGPRAILHIIGERPGTGHHTFSIYITAPTGSTWGKAGKTDHDITKVVSGVAITALQPIDAAVQTAEILKEMYNYNML
jgi:ethanolamine ammonia-lyase large subunit